MTLGNTQCKEQLNPQRPLLTKLLYFAFAWIKKTKYVYFLLQKKRFQDTFMRGRKRFPFRNSDVNATKPRASLTSTPSASIAVPLEHGGNLTAVFSLLEHCMHEFLIWKVFVHKGLCMMDYHSFVPKDSYIVKCVPENITMYEKRNLQIWLNEGFWYWEIIRRYLCES